MKILRTIFTTLILVSSISAYAACEAPNAEITGGTANFDGSCTYTNPHAGALVEYGPINQGQYVYAAILCK